MTGRSSNDRRHPSGRLGGGEPRGGGKVSTGAEDRLWGRWTAQGQPWRRRTWLEEGGVYPEGVEGTVGDTGRGMAVSQREEGYTQ